MSDWFEKTFLKKWRTLDALGRGADYDRAVLVREAKAKLKDEKLAEALRRGCDLSNGRVRTLFAQADALAVVPNKATWTACGWKGVRLLAQAKTDETRRQIEKALLNEVDLRGGPLGEVRVTKVVQRIAPGLIPQRDGGRRGLYSADMFKREIERLLSSHLIHPAVLSEDVRRALGVAEEEVVEVRTS